jgi:uncharacterized membrane protein
VAPIVEAHLTKESLPPIPKIIEAQPITLRALSSDETVIKQNTSNSENNYLCFSIITCLCFCWPFGIRAIICSKRAIKAFKNNDIREGQKQAKCALIWNIFGVCIGIVVAVVSIAISYSQNYKNYGSYYG